MTFILGFLKKYKIEALLAPFLKMSEALLELFVPFVIADIIDSGIPLGDRSFIVNKALVLLLLAFAGLVFSVTAQYLSARAAVKTAADMKSALFKKITSFSYSQLDNIGTSALITRMTSDINQVQSGINLTLRLFLRSPFIVFGAMIMAFILDRREAVIFVVMIIVMSVIVFAVMGITLPRHKKVQSAVDSLTLTARENVTGVRVIRAFGSEDKQKDVFNTKNEFLNKSQRVVAAVSSLTNPLTLVVVNLAVAALITSGAVKVNAGELTPGTVVALYNYLTQILTELIKLANLIVNITKSLAGADRIAAVFNTETEKAEPDLLTKPYDENAPVIAFKNVSFKYDRAGEPSLENINFELFPGKKLGVIGATGSGKSTLGFLASGFYSAFDGNIDVFGSDIRKYDKSFLNTVISVVEQKAVLFKGSVRDNILIGAPSADDGEIISALKTAQAYDFIKQKDGFLDFVIEQNGRNLSGGQRQRLTVARAVVKRPQLLILDDCSSALDYATDSLMRSAVDSLDCKPAQIIISQRVASVRNADRILVLDDGEPAGYGTHDELYANCDVYKEICHSQLGKEGE